MSVKEMWKSFILTKIVLIFVGFVTFSFGNGLAWTIVGGMVLISACWMMFRQGQGAGHASCSVSKSLERVAGDENIAAADEKLLRQAWSPNNGFKSIFAGALVAFVINCFYIVCTLVKAPMGLVLGSRIVSWVVTLPYWPVVAMFHETYTALTPDIVLVLMLSPFLLPVCHYIGYMQGPKLWERTEKAMADGKRRAKARSRIVKKKGPRVQKPQI